MLVLAPPPSLPPSNFPLPLEPSGVKREPPSTRNCPLIIEGLGQKKDSVSSLSLLATELQWAEQELSATTLPPVPTAPVTVKPVPLVVALPFLATRLAVPTTNTPPFSYSFCATTAPSLSNPTSPLSNTPDPSYKNKLWPGVKNSPIFDAIDFNHNRRVKFYQRTGELRRRPGLGVWPGSPVPVSQSSDLPPHFWRVSRFQKLPNQWTTRTWTRLTWTGVGGH